MVEQCSNNNTVYNDSISSPNSNQNENDNNKNVNGSYKNNRSEYWKLLIDDLKRYGDIKLAIKDHLKKRDIVTKEIDELNAQKQEISLQYQYGISAICEINNKISYFKDYIDHYSKDLENKIKASSKISGPLPIFIICNNSEENNKENRDNKDNRN